MILQELGNLKNNNMIKTQSTYHPENRFSLKSDFDKENQKPLVSFEKGLETSKEKNNTGLKIEYSILPNKTLNETDIKEVPLSRTMGFWTNFNDEKYKKLLNIKNELFKHS